MSEGGAPTVAAPSVPTGILRIPDADMRGRVFCFPYSGAGASMYAQWPHKRDGIEFCRVQPPGRENRIREPHYGTYDRLAVQLADELGDYLDLPYVVFGHCSSALAAYAFVREVRDRGFPTPEALVVSSEVAPHQEPYGRFLTMSDEQLLAEMGALIRSMGDEPNSDYLQMGLAIMKADLAANRCYRLLEVDPVPCPVVSVGWNQDVEVAPILMSGWEQYTNDYQHTILEGNHHAFMAAPMSLLLELEGLFEL